MEIIKNEPTNTQLQFYEKLSDFLKFTSTTFQNQGVVRNQLTDMLKADGRFVWGVLEYEEMFAKFHKEMDERERRRFNFIRQITEDLAKHNQDMFTLLDDNRARLKDGEELTLLYDHLQFWLSKYRSQKDDPDMCLIYVGVEERKPFPKGVEKFVADKITELSK